MARPRKKVDADLVEKLASLHCTKTEIASIAGCSVDTLDRRFAEVMDKGFNKGKLSLRRWQWQAAEKGNVVMMIWLGKQYLGQAEKIKEEIQADVKTDNTLHLNRYLTDLIQSRKKDD